MMRASLSRESDIMFMRRSSSSYSIACKGVEVSILCMRRGFRGAAGTFRDMRWPMIVYLGYLALITPSFHLGAAFLFTLRLGLRSSNYSKSGSGTWKDLPPPH